MLGPQLAIPSLAPARHCDATGLDGGKRRCSSRITGCAALAIIRNQHVGLTIVRLPPVDTLAIVGWRRGQLDAVVGLSIAASHADNASMHSLRFGSFTLLPGEQRLLRDGEEVALAARAFGVLCALAERSGQVVSKDELLSSVWRGRVVEEANLHVQVSLLRKAIGADAIATVSGEGYRFAWPVVKVIDEPHTRTLPIIPELRRLSVIVLPFVELSAPAAQDYFADAITDGVTTQLSKIVGSYVIGSPTALTFKRQLVDLPELARDLGVRYALQGQLERSGEGVEANVRLSDAATGAVVWAEVFEVATAGVGHLRRELVARLANALNLQLIAAEASRITDEDAVHPAAIDLVMRAWACGSGRQARSDCLELCDRALHIQAGFAPALVARAQALAHLAHGWPGSDYKALVMQADGDIAQALAQDSLDARTYQVQGFVRRLQFRFDAALAALDQALALNPNDSQAFAWRGAVLLYTGATERANESLGRALTLSPCDPDRWWWMAYTGVTHLFAGRYEQALLWLDKSLALMPYWSTELYAIAANAQLNRDSEAKAGLRRLLERAPMVAAYLRDERLSNHEGYLEQRCRHFADGLVKAGAEHLLGPRDAWLQQQRQSEF
jgi:DNA-binding winged helix-turn-helix (wHTH) protein/tetratricopeptide (TPR) repeat protein